MPFKPFSKAQQTGRAAKTEAKPSPIAKVAAKAAAKPAPFAAKGKAPAKAPAKGKAPPFGKKAK